MKIAKVISGGQTGGDMGGLLAAKDCKIPTGGTAPAGYRTDDGKNSNLANFGLVEHKSFNYPPRTECNVKDSDLTIIFGNDHSAGCSMTKRLCSKHSKKCLLVRDFTQEEFVNVYRALTENFRDDLIINIAGNRETPTNNIEEKTRMFLQRIFIVLNKVI